MGCAREEVILHYSMICDDILRDLSLRFSAPLGRARIRCFDITLNPASSRRRGSGKPR